MPRLRQKIRCIGEIYIIEEKEGVLPKQVIFDDKKKYEIICE